MENLNYKILFVISTICFIILGLFNFIIIYPALEESNYNSAYLCRSEKHFDVCISDVYYPDLDTACFYPSNSDIFEDSFCIKDFVKINSRNNKTE